VASEGQNLGDGAWLRQRQPAWSIFVKSSTVPSWLHHGGSFGVDGYVKEHSVKAQSLGEAAANPSADLAPQALLGDGNAESEQPCEWLVHYDRWIPTFAAGEFEHNDKYGGAHCLDACCRDPTCTGLALESSEQFQCYKYTQKPVGLEPSRGRRLGDGNWLKSQRAAWSIFLKADSHKDQASKGLRRKQPVRVQRLQHIQQSKDIHNDLLLAQSKDIHKDLPTAAVSSAIRIAYYSSSLFDVVVMLSFMAL
jgi:hypothetical protein